MATCKIDLRDLITQEAQRQGVDPAIAVSVAQRETGMCQWNPDGSVVRGKAGEVGLFQLMPDTAAGLGVDPFDVNQNIRGGVLFLKQLYQKYGSWGQAIAAWNWGPGKVDRAAAVGAEIPGVVQNYVNAVLGIGKAYSATVAKMQEGAQQAGVAASQILGSVMPSANRNMIVAVLVIGSLAIAGMLISAED